MLHNERKEKKDKKRGKSEPSTSAEDNQYEELLPPPESPNSFQEFKFPVNQQFETSTNIVRRFQEDKNTIEEIDRKVSGHSQILKNQRCLIITSFVFITGILLFGAYSTYQTYRTYNGYEEIGNELKYLAEMIQGLACVDIPDTSRSDCYPEKQEPDSFCHERSGCCFDIGISKHHHSRPEGSDVYVPFCYYQNDRQVYKFENLTQVGNDYIGFMKLKEKSHHLNDLPLVKIESTNIDESTLRVKLFDPKKKRYEPPWPKIKTYNQSKSSTEDTLYSMEIDKSAPGFAVKRKSDGTTVFNSNGVGIFIFADQFLEMTSTLASHDIYGLGEHKSPLKLSTNWKRFTFFNSGNVPKEKANLYGSHPFYLIIENSGNCHGVLFLNSNAMDIILNPGPRITFRSIGGIFDFFFFLGPTPSDVLKQYAEIVGKPFLPPYWSLGFHLSRYNYGSVAKTKETWNRMRAAKIPFDTQWNDIDYMDKGNVFTYDKENYKDLPQFVKEIQSQGMHYIPLIDAGISGSSDKNNTPYIEGLEQCIFIQRDSNPNRIPGSSVNCNPFTGKARNPESTVWPDFTHINIQDYYLKMMKNLHQNFSFDGVWLNMNDPFNSNSNGCPENGLDDPGFVPHVIGESLSKNSLCMNAKHQLGNHYDLHNTYGTSQSAITYKILKSLRNRRPFIISRSTWIGHGSFAGHWTGDIHSSWGDMKASIPQILSFSFFQIPMVGADICGYLGDTTESLCSRWMQLGAFYPFSRNHNSDNTIDQDPVALGDLVTRSSRESLMIRYRLLPYLYTLFFRAHQYGETVARPLFFEFTSDRKTYDIDTQFLWGKSLMIVPVLENGATRVNAYVPQGKWYNYHTNESIVSSDGEYKTLEAPSDKIPLLIRGGSILPEQEPGMTTTESRKNKFGLLIALDEDNSAEGELYWDDGDSVDPIQNGNYRRVYFVAKNGTLTSSIKKDQEMPVNGFSAESMTLGYLKIMGTKDPVNTVFCNNLKVESDKFYYDQDKNCLVIHDLEQDLEGRFSLTWKYIHTNSAKKFVLSKLFILPIFFVSIVF